MFLGDISSQSAGSWLWQKILKERHLARPFLSTMIGSGNKALFWHDDWTSLGPLIDLTCLTGPRVTGINIMALVAQTVCNQRWLVPQGRNPICVLLRVCLPIVPSFDANLQDQFQWRHSPNTNPGIFSSSLT